MSQGQELTDGGQDSCNPQQPISDSQQGNQRCTAADLRFTAGDLLGGGATNMQRQPEPGSTAAGEVSGSFELYDLNLLPSFAPITPEKFTRKHRQWVSEVGNLAMNSAAESSLAASRPSNTVLRTETRQPKQRRKKHRPKVITERKPRKRKPAEEKATTAQDKPTVKRKYVWRNKTPEGLATPLGDTNGETVRCKRKYARKKYDSKEPAAATTDETEVGTSDVEVVLEPTKKRCRRALNFDSQFNFASQNLAKQQNGSTSTTGCSDVLIMREQTMEVGVACSIIGCHNQVQKDSLLLPEHAPRTPLHPKTTRHRKKYIAEVYEKNPTGQANINNSTCISKENACSLSTDEQADATRASLYGDLYDSLLAYRAPFQQQMLPIQKKKRSEKWQPHASAPTVAKSNVSWGPFFIDDRISVHGSEVSGSQVDIGDAERKDFNGKLQAHLLEQTNSVRKKRSEGNTRIRGEFASLNIMRKFTEAQTPGHANTESSYTSMGELLAKMDSKLARKKRTKKSPIVPAYFSNNEKRCIIISNQNGFPTNFIGPPEAMWIQFYSIDAIVEMLRHLQICEEVSTAPYQQSKALVPYNTGRYDPALVSYRDGTIIPFEPAKNRRSRPKVDLDEETDRVWKLLLGNINSEGIDGNDEEKAKWWEEERRIFRGRADSFIARMHLVQGDRRFSPWKGSVVDSVVGVFLTQNVSDHLSSSAFMSMAAHFPVKQKDKGKFCEDGTTLKALGQNYCVSDPEEISKWNENESVRQIGDQSSMTVHSYGQLERDADDSNESSVCGINSSGSICESRKELPHSSGRCFDLYNHCSENGSITERTAQETEFSKKDETIDEAFSQNSVISSQDSAELPIVQTVETVAHYTQDNSGREEQPKCSKISFSNDSTSVELLQMFGSNMLYDVNVHDTYKSHVLEGTQSLNIGSLNIGASEGPKCLLSGKSILSTEYLGHANVSIDAELLDMFKEQRKTIQNSNTKDVNSLKRQSPVIEESVIDQTDSTISNPEVPSSADNQQNESIDKKKNMKREGKRQSLVGNDNVVESSVQRQNMKSKTNEAEKEKKDDLDWDYLRKQVESNGKKRERTESSMDSVDWEAVRCADVNEIAQTIKGRGMNNVLAERIKDFLNRLASDHGSIDLEWLRDVPPDKAKEYLLSVRGLGLKSVECVRLLTLHHLAFPVDTNVGRIAVRLGWVPLQPLPESLQLHLLELYPILASIQKYLWPRLCKLDQRTLYELHYQMITFGKVFCTKNKPNCNACPMRGECRHFASAFASARLALPGPEEKGVIIANENRRPDQNHTINNPQPFLLPQLTEQPNGRQLQARSAVANCEPIIEEPSTPEPECTQAQEVDIEDSFCVDEIPKIELNMEQLSQNLLAYVENNMELQGSDLSKALVALTAEAASIPAPKLKNISQLRTEHHVYELPDSHPLLTGMDKREADDPCKYLLAIWAPGETPNSIQPPEKSCSSQEHGFLCMEITCFSCNSKREAESQIVRGTLLIPCRTAMRGSFPLNGTYFQVNEVFADHKSSRNPIEVPRNWLWNLPRRTVYFGTSIPTIFRGLTTEGIQHCFWKGFVCVRGFDRKTRAPQPLLARLHFPASKLATTRGRAAE